MTKKPRGRRTEKDFKYKGYENEMRMSANRLLIAYQILDVPTDIPFFQNFEY